MIGKCGIHYFKDCLKMPRIVNGQVVNDDVPQREPPKNRIRTWNDIQSGRGASREDGNTLRNRTKEEKKPEIEVVTPPPASIPQYLINAFGLENYTISIPPSNPVLSINAVYLILFVFFTIIFGYKMAVLYVFGMLFIDCVDHRVIPHRAKAIYCLLKKQKINKRLNSSSLVCLLS